MDVGRVCRSAVQASSPLPALFNATGWDFEAEAPFFNGAVVEHDAAAGLAFVFQQAAARFGPRAPFTPALDAALGYLDSLPSGTPVLYELLAPFGAYAAARRAAEGGWACHTHTPATTPPRE
jgi:hypothetical protein